MRIRFDKKSQAIFKKPRKILLDPEWLSSRVVNVPSSINLI